MGLTRERVYKRIDGEREYQDGLNPNALPLATELVLLREYLRRAEKAFTETFGDPHEVETMAVVRKLAGICVRAMEQHGAPERKK